MKENKNLFRDFYRRYALIPLKDLDMEEFKQYDGYGEADYVLGFGFVSVAGGLKVIGLQLAKGVEDCHLYRIQEEDFALIEPSRLLECDYRTDILLTEEEMNNWAKEFVENEDTGLSTFYAIELIDDLRDPLSPGCVRVLLTKEGLEAEECLVACTQFLNGSLGVGPLKEEPKQDFGVHVGHEVSFTLRRNDDGSVFCQAVLDVETDAPSGSLCDGSMLVSALKRMIDKPNMEHLNDVMDVLSDTKVLVPCDVLEPASKFRIEHALKQEKFSMEDGMEGCFKIEGLRFQPVIAKAADMYFLQVYTDQALIDQQVECDVSVWKTVPETFVTAVNMPVAFAGLLINPDSDTELLIERNLWDRILNMSDLIEIKKEKPN